MPAFSAAARLGRRITLTVGGLYAVQDPATADRYAVLVGRRAGQPGAAVPLSLSYPEVLSLHAVLTAAIAAHEAPPDGWLPGPVEGVSGDAA